MLAISGSTFAVSIGEVVAFLNQIADLAKEGRVGRAVDSLARIVTEPGIELCLHRRAHIKEFAVAWGKGMDSGVEAGPEISRRDTRTIREGRDQQNRQAPLQRTAVRGQRSRTCISPGGS